MGRMYEALRRLEREHRGPGVPEPGPAQEVNMFSGVLTEPVEVEGTRSAKVQVSQASRLVALNDPKSLGAEKFRVLVTRLENLRIQREIRSLQIISSKINEGKSLVSANLAATFAKRRGSKVLLVEGDLHRPTLATLLGFTQSTGLVDWWSTSAIEISPYLYRLNDLPLWFLSAGAHCDQPSEILQSSRFANEFTKLKAGFDWIVVDSTPMLPTVDSNLWSRLVDGSLLVVREGVASVKALKKGLEALDNPKLVGMVLNEASEFDRANYAEQYYGSDQKIHGSSKETVR